MARKLKSESESNVFHEFTRQIHSTKRAGTRFHAMENWNEKEAKEQNKLCCHDCRSFDIGCSEFVGKYHKRCEEFGWW